MKADKKRSLNWITSILQVLAVEIMQPLHALSVHEEMELLGVMVIVYGKMDNVIQKVKLKVPSLDFKIRLDIDPVTLFST